MSDIVNIDGSQGEGGGQILRTALALSMALGRPFRIQRIRAGRDKPGLMRQHLTCITAAQAICSAEVRGVEAGSQELEFRPSPVRPGSYHFAVGTAGSTTLVLQAILPPLLAAGGPSRIAVEGGTHNRGAPPYDFFERALAPLLSRMGPAISTRLERHGFYPAGGGRITVDITPAQRLAPLDLPARGEVRAHSARILLSKLPLAIADRELQTIHNILGWPVDRTAIVYPESARGPGNAVMLEIQSEHATEVFSCPGELGKSAERVAEEAAREARDYLASTAAVGPHLADQLMVPISLAGRGAFSTGPLTRHTTTNAQVIALFTGRQFKFEGTRRVMCTLE